MIFYKVHDVSFCWFDVLIKYYLIIFALKYFHKRREREKKRQTLVSPSHIHSFAFSFSSFIFFNLQQIPPPSNSPKNLFNIDLFLQPVSFFVVKRHILYSTLIPKLKIKVHIHNILKTLTTRETLYSEFRFGWGWVFVMVVLRSSSIQPFLRGKWHGLCVVTIVHNTQNEETKILFSAKRNES